MSKYRLFRPAANDTGAMGPHLESCVIDYHDAEAPRDAVRVSDDTPESDWNVYIPNPHELPREGE